MDGSGNLLLKLFIVLLLVLFNGFFVAAEFAMVKVRSSRMRELAESGNKRAKIGQNLLAHLNAYLSACQLGITLASLGLGWIGEPVVAELISGPLQWLGLGSLVETSAFVIAFLVITFLHIVLGELAPKSFAIQRSEGTVLTVAPVLIVFYKVMYPFIWILNQAANRLLRTLGIVITGEAEEAHTEEELRILMSESHRRGFIDQTELALFDNVFEFSDRVAREIMVPRIDMATLDVSFSEDKVLETMAKNEYTRYPVMRRDKDHILGYLHVKDMYLRGSSIAEFNLAAMIRDVIRVPETAEISSVLKLMQKHRTQMAVVVDEYGGTAGLITMEDIIEELVGEIQDEFDDELPPMMKTEVGYSVDGRVLLEEIDNLLGTHLNEEDLDTLGGWLRSLLKKNPAHGDVVRREGYLFTVEKTSEHRIDRVVIRQETQAPQAP